MAFVGYLPRFWGELDGNNARAAVVATAAIWGLTWVNALGVRMGGWVQGVTTVLKLLPLVAIATIGLPSFDPANFGEFNAAGGSRFTNLTGAAATLTLWAFIGLESATVPAEDVRDPSAIPRSTVMGTALDRGHHHRWQRAGPGPRRASMHELPARARSRLRHPRR